MKYEKTIKDERGTLKIEVILWTAHIFWERDINGDSFRYDLIVTLTEKGKRKEIKGKNFLHLLTDDEILQAKMELHNLIRPK